MANLPEDPVLEFHIRRMKEGLVSHFVFDQLQTGEWVDVSGPQGAAFLREAHTGPIIAVAGGSGLAPIHAIVTQALRSGMKQPIALYFGAREERDLYYEARFRELEREFAHFAFIPVLSNAVPGESSVGIRRLGLVGNALLDDQVELSNVKVYMAGPPPMVDSLTSALVERGVALEDIHADAFVS